MLYVTTRSKHDAYTAARALREDRAPDGGFYLPFQMPTLSPEQLLQLGAKNYGQCAAEILNLFFPGDLTGWDVDFCIGKYPIRVAAMQPRILVGELWHNERSAYLRQEQALYARLCGGDGKPTSWAQIAIRIASFAGVYGEMLRIGALEPGKTFDAVLPAFNMSGVMALWYARQMGFPIGNIVCGCNENSALWELLHIGEVRTDAPAVKTSLPEADLQIQPEAERLIFAALGLEEALRFCAALESKRAYALPLPLLERLRDGMYTAVISESRTIKAIPNVYKTTGYLMGPYTALAYSGLLDYRAKTGENRTALLLAEKSPVFDCGLTAAAMGISQRELRILLDETQR